MSVMTRELPDLRERIAVAANTSDLSPDGRAVDVVAAMGAASMAMRWDADSGRMVAKVTEVGTVQVDAGKRLAALLERAKYARDRKAERPAVILFAHWLGKKRSFCNKLRIKSGSDLLMRFAGAVVTEWLHDRCAQCGGGGWLRVGRETARNTRTELCGVCKGSGRARVEHVTRCQILGVERNTYDAHWLGRFEDARTWLEEIEQSNIAPLQRQLRRGTLAVISE